MKSGLVADLRRALSCRCPRCDTGSLYEPGLFNLSLRAHCESCGLALADNDNGDGPAVFLIFVLGFTLVPLALWLEFSLAPPLWVHGVVFGLMGLGIVFGTLRPLKSYVLLLQYKHRPESWTR